MNVSVRWIQSIILSLLFVTQYDYCLAQAKPAPIIVPSPNAGSLGVYGELPVSTFTGIPDINIPICDVKGTKLSLPISLRYHAGGNRTDMHPGWVGLGWSLFTGGTITRIMKGHNDELNAQLFEERGYYYSRGRLTNANWASDAEMKTYPDLSPDDDPDEFTFNFLGYSGKFFLNQNGKWVVQSDKPLKVVFDEADFITPYILKQPVYVVESTVISKTFGKFTIIDEWGNQYVFGGDNGIEYSDEIAPDYRSMRNGEAHIATSWHLIRVIAANGEEAIDLTYERGPFVSNLFTSFTSSSLNGSAGSFLEPGCSNFSERINLNGRIISPVYLRRIESKNIAVDFNISKSDELTYPSLAYSNISRQYYGAGGYLPFLQQLDAVDIPYFTDHQRSGERYKNFIWLKLDDIKIRNKKSGQIYQTVNFAYNNIPTKRLELNGVEFTENTTGQKKRYDFTYNPTELPNYMEGMGDHWGYHNGVYNPQGITFINYATAKQANVDYAKARILETITYPTGGKTTLQYALNTYTKIVSRDRTSLVNETGAGGGLRVAKLINQDAMGNIEEKEYFYVKGYSNTTPPASLPSSGVLDVKPQYYFNITNAVDMSGLSFQYQIYASTAVIPVTLNSTGLAVGYTEVVEKRKDGAYTIHKYTNHDNGYKDIPAINSYNKQNVAYIPFTSLDFERGKLLEQNSYNNNGKLLKKEAITYGIVGDQVNDVARARHKSIFLVCAGSAGRQAFTNCAYLLPHYAFLPLKKNDTTYEVQTNSYIDVSQEFTYHPGYRLLRSTQQKLSNGNTGKEELYYPFDFYAQQSNNVYRKMTDNNQLAHIVERRALLTEGQTNYITDAQLNAFSEITTGKFVKTEQFGFENPERIPLTNFTATTFSNGLQKDSRYALRGTLGYDASSLNLKETKLDGGETYSYIWSYNNTLPVAITNGAPPNETAYSGFEAEENGNWRIPDNRRLTESVAGKQAYSLANGNIDATPPTGKSYRVSCWAKNGIPKVNGQNPATTGASSNGWTYYEYSFNGTGTVTISGNAYIDELKLLPVNAEMTTYSYDEFLGLTSIIDPKNDIRHFEYDGFQRLKLIRNRELKIIKQIDYQYQAWGNNVAAWKATGNTRCQQGTGGFLTGVQEKEEKDINPNSTTYNQLRWIGSPNTAACPIIPNWTATGNTRCQQANGVYTGRKEAEEKDTNPYSSTYNTLRWADRGDDNSCTSTAIWQDTGNKRCKKDSKNENTGELEKEQVDANPLSASYGVKKWISLGINTSECPVILKVYASIERRHVAVTEDQNLYEETGEVYVVLKDQFGNRVNATNITINYKEDIDRHTGAVANNKSITFSGSEALIMMGTLSIYHFNAQGAPYNYTSYFHSILPGNGYINN